MRIRTARVKEAPYVKCPPAGITPYVCRQTQGGACSGLRVAQIRIPHYL